MRRYFAIELEAKDVEYVTVTVQEFYLGYITCLITFEFADPYFDTVGLCF